MHNLAIDKLEVHEKASFITSYPYEVPCQSLMSALLNYKMISDQFKSILPFLLNFDLTNYQLVHLKNLSEKRDFDDFGFCSSSLD